MRWSLKLAARPTLWVLPQGIVYMGPLPPNQTHAHRALQVLISQKKLIEVDQGPNTDVCRARAVLIRPLVRHRVKPQLNSAVSIFYEPGPLQFPAGDVFQPEPLHPPDVELSRIKGVLEGGLSSADAAVEIFSFGLGLAQIRLIASQDLKAFDSRVSDVILKLRENRGPSFTLQALAADLGVSPSRLIHLFSAQMKMPLRSYYLWVKVVRAIEHIAGGASLTESAHESGFSDSAHFSRVFSRTFGFPPSYLRFMQINRVKKMSELS